MASTSRILSTKAGEPASRRRVKREIVNKNGTRTILGPRGLQTVRVKKGDIISTITSRDGTIRQFVDSKNVQQSKSKNQVSKNRTNNSTLTTVKTSKPVTTLLNVSSTLNNKKITSYEFWYFLNPNNAEIYNNVYNRLNNIELDFVNSYVDAYKNNKSKLEQYNILLSRFGNKDLIWKAIWPRLDSANTSERSAAQHEMLFDNKGVGQMNWYNIFNGNLLLATDENSLDYVSPEWRLKTILLSTPVSTQGSPTNYDVDNIILNNLDKFKSQWDYAKLHNKNFDYSSSSFDSTGLPIQSKYGGIGDFMDTYNLSPDLLYSILERTFNIPAKKLGGILRQIL